MLNDIVFVGQAEAERTPGRKDWVVVSITQPSEPDVCLKPGWRAILRLKFHDTDDEGSLLTVFDMEKARSVLAFVETHAKDAVGVMVHCHEGVSRSAAIAIFLGERYQIDGFLKKHAGYTRHNRLVYRRLCEAGHSGEVCISDSASCD